MGNINQVRKLKGKFPGLDYFSPSFLNEEVFRFYRQFTDDEFMLISALVQNPWGRTEDVDKVREHLGPIIGENIERLNQMHGMEREIFRHLEKDSELAVLFLLNFYFILNNFPHGEILPIPREKIVYASEMLERIHIAEVRSLLIDKFFFLLYPEIYKSYSLLTQITRRKYSKRQLELKTHMEQILSTNDIKGKVEGRIKSIYSIHQKITRKNLLFSQVLDTIGLRIIVDQEEDCYRLMVLLIENDSVITFKIKDYIADPKKNGYQSIHLAVFYENHPVEIQIRTWEMHRVAQFGRASHFVYKKTVKKNSEPNFRHEWRADIS